MKKYTQDQLDEIIKLHAFYLAGDKNGEMANLSEANLSEANLSGANLSEAIGNGLNIISLQTRKWPVAYTDTHMQIGCQLHKISDWWGFDDDRISAMENSALEWWRTWKPILKSIIDASPASPTGYTE